MGCVPDKLVNYMEKNRNGKLTINDIATLAGVSKATVSFYLNGRTDKMSEKTAQKIQEIIDRTGYRPNALARSLNDKRTNMIGVIIGDITNSFANQIVKGIDDYAQEKGYQLILASSSYSADKERRLTESMNEMGADGFIVQPTVQYDAVWQTMNVSKPLVYFDSPTASNGTPWVKTNNYEAVYNAAETMTARGYERFVMITADPYVLRTRMERNKGFADCLELAGKPHEIIIADTHTSAEELEEKLQAYVTGDKPACIFVCNNWLLDKTYLALRPYRHLIPERLGLVGFDSLEWSELAIPSITTIVQPAYEEGRAAARILIDRIEERNEVEPNQILSCRINYQESTNRTGQEA